MTRHRQTIARWMGLTAILALDMALVRTIATRRFFNGGDLIFLVLQAGLWFLFRSQGRLRRFWAAFVGVFAVAALVVLFCDALLDDLLDSTGFNDLIDWLEITYLPRS